MNLDIVRNYKVLVVGDGIIDEYNYVTTIGKSIKDNIISTKFRKKESWRGGVWAAAAHTKNFCNEVDVWTGPTTMKNQRFVDDFMHKLFTIHHVHDSMMDQIETQISEYDLVIVTDFGHGCLTRKLIAKISDEAKYLAVNAQTNSTNYGFNMITRYPRADFVVIDELEARLAVHNRESSLEEVIPKLGFPKVVVTKGNQGAIGFDGEFHHAPSMAEKVIDTMGAGDAFLCVTAPFAKAGLPMKDLLKIGNAAGAVKVGIVGHQKSVTKEALREVLQ
jgi:bifunctional ADP-heptose synthase (sugar kinase/adenylyltransferase)